MRMWNRLGGAALAAVLVAVLFGFASERQVAAQGVPNVDDAVGAWGQTGEQTSKVGKFVMRMVATPANELWIGTEDDGVWRWTGSGKQWQRFSEKDGLTDTSCYALACDHQGRIWVGHLREGVSVWDGKGWKHYGVTEGETAGGKVENGPLGARVFDIAVNPKDGDVWVATSAGLSRYEMASGAWVYYGWLEGLPADQVRRIAFDKDGNIYLAMFCEGLVIGKADDGYKKWKQVTAKVEMPSGDKGDGLPSNLVNDVCVAGGAIYVGTVNGLAWSADKGEHFQFVRGKDWRANVEGKFPAMDAVGDGEGVMAQDWVSSVADGGTGKVWIGHRTAGWELLDVMAGKIIAGQDDPTGPITAVLPVPLSKMTLIGHYGEGVSTAETEEANPPMADSAAPSVAPAIAAAKPPSVADLDEMLRAVQAVKSAEPGQRVAAFLGEDWVTQGDWLGRYGRRFTVELPDYSNFGVGQGEELAVQVGPRPGAAGPYGYWDGEKSENPKWLWNPQVGTRRMGELNDGSFSLPTFPYTMDGPDLWLKIGVSGGTHRLSLYFLNPNGHTKDNRMRDYRLELRPYEDDDLVKALGTPATAQTRVSEFWGGVYKQFIVSGPGRYWLRIGRNHSFATRANGVFIDKVAGAKDEFDAAPLPFLGAVKYEMPAVAGPVEVAQGGGETMRRAIALWAALDTAYEKPESAAWQVRGRIMAYRAAAGVQASDNLLAKWRWQLGLWTETARDEFAKTMADAWEKQKDTTPANQSN